MKSNEVSITLLSTDVGKAAMGNSHSNDYRWVWSPYFRNLKDCHDLEAIYVYKSSCRPEPTRGADRIRGDGDGKGVGGNRGGVENAAHKKNGFRSQLSGGSTASPSHTTMVGVAGGGGVIATAGMLKVWKDIFWTHPDIFCSRGVSWWRCTTIRAASLATWLSAKETRWKLWTTLIQTGIGLFLCTTPLCV